MQQHTSTALPAKLADRTAYQMLRSPGVFDPAGSSALSSSVVPVAGADAICGAAAAAVQ